MRGKPSVLGNGMYVDACFQTMSMCFRLYLPQYSWQDTFFMLPYKFVQYLLSWSWNSWWAITKLWQEPFTPEIWVRTSPYNGNCCNGVVAWCSVMLNCLVGHTGNRDRHQWVFYPMHYVWDPLKEILSQWKLMTGQLGQHLTSVRKSSELHIACVCAGGVRNANYQW